MTDEERIERLENKLKDVTSWWRAAEKQFSQKCKETKANQKTIERLEAKNAELRARLEKAVELPAIYEHISYPYLERMYSEIIYYVIYKENGRIMTEKFGKNKSKAEARLKELKEKNND